MGDVRRINVINSFPTFDDVGNADMVLLMAIVTTGINTRARGR